MPFGFFMAPFDFTQGWSGSPINLSQNRIEQSGFLSRANVSFSNRSLSAKQLKGVGKTELAPSALFRQSSFASPKPLTFPGCDQ